MMRPRLQDLFKGRGIIACPCGAMLHNNNDTSDHWGRGHFDFDKPTLVLHAAGVKDWAETYAQMDYSTTALMTRK